ncbi:IS4 family transposase [Thiothrix subterranea]|uniref:IS4 family transposase n=1 Tax=Thiothrix subterranea TaxID=2735563 RepID=UPI00192C50EB|nr:IS4 family transposase [Thiothrix subterranea]QQZ30208.1 IS4 family transposase [Thiothrix subterranea]
MNWSSTELTDLDLGDKRLETRAAHILKAMLKAPQSSIPKACQSWSSTLATYRFFWNEAVSHDALMASHFEATECRIRQQDSRIILCIQDTTELDFNGQETEGLGRLSYDKQRGMYLHPTLCITPERLPLGITDTWMWSRGLSKAADQANPSIKESRRWIEGYERVAELAARCPEHRLIYAGDRESDFYDLLKRAQALDYPADLLIRAQHNRALGDDLKLWDAIDQQKALTRITFTKPRKQGEKPRKVVQEIKVLRYTLRPKSKHPMLLTLVQAKEINPPAGKSPLIWRLVTNRCVETADAACELIDWYRARWEIEMFFDVLKVGCRIEKLQLDTKERIEKALALYIMVAWRIMFLMRLGRTCPELPADLVFDPLEWKVSFRLGKKALPDGIPTLNQVIRNLAELGGFLGRKSDGEPGAKSIWLGYSRVLDCIYGIQMASELGMD